MGIGQRTGPLFRRLLLAGMALVLLAGVAEARMVCAAAEMVTMHAGPDREQEVLWELGVGYPLQVVEEQGAWLKVIDYQGDSGWVEKEMVLSDKTCLVVTKPIVNVRSGPGNNYRIVRQAHEGVVFLLLESKGEWAKVLHEEENVTGWVLRTLLWGW